MEELSLLRKTNRFGKAPMETSGVELEETQIVTRSGRSFGVGRPGGKESFNDSHVGPSDPVALSGPTPTAEDGGTQFTQKSDRVPLTANRIL